MTWQSDLHTDAKLSVHKTDVTAYKYHAICKQTWHDNVWMLSDLRTKMANLQINCPLNCFHIHRDTKISVRCRSMASLSTTVPNQTKLNTSSNKWNGTQFRQFNHDGTTSTITKNPVWINCKCCCKWNAQLIIKTLQNLKVRYWLVLSHHNLNTKRLVGIFSALDWLSDI